MDFLSSKINLHTLYSSVLEFDALRRMYTYNIQVLWHSFRQLEIRILLHQAAQDCEPQPYHPSKYCAQQVTNITSYRHSSDTVSSM